eukprot:910329-Pyramimonas_sp.AAC.1
MEDDDDILALFLEVEGEEDNVFATAQSEAFASAVSLRHQDDTEARHAEISAMVNAGAGVAPSVCEISAFLPDGPVPVAGPLLHDGVAVAGSVHIDASFHLDDFGNQI